MSAPEWPRDDRRHTGGQRRWPVPVGAALALVALGAVLGRATASPPPVEQERPGDASAPSPGPSRVEASVPIGYERSGAGAVAAATAYTAALGSPGAFLDDQRGAMLDVIAANSSRERLGAEIAQSFDVPVEALGLTPEVIRDRDFVARPVPAGYRLISYSDDEAVVEVWGTAVFFVPGRQATSGEWTTVTVELRWQRGDWRLAATRSREGPAPPETPTPPTPDIGERLNDFNRYAHVPIPE